MAAAKEEKEVTSKAEARMRKEAHAKKEAGQNQTSSKPYPILSISHLLLVHTFSKPMPQIITCIRAFNALM